MGKIKNRRANSKHNLKVKKSVVIKSQDEKFSSEKVSNTLSDLVSLEEKKRLKACRILSHICATNAGNHHVLFRLTAPDILSKLRIRLSDGSVQVRYEAVGVIRNLAVCHFPDVIHRIICSGLLDSMYSLTAEALNMSILNLLPDTPLCLQLIQALCNFVSSHESYATSFCNALECLLPLLLTAIEDSRSALTLQLAIVNLLFISSDNFEACCSRIISLGGVSVLARAVQNNNNGGNGICLDSLTLGLKCAGVLLNVSECGVEFPADHVGDLRFSSVASFIIDSFDQSRLLWSHLSEQIQTIASSKSAAGSNDAVKSLEFIKVSAEVLTNLVYMLGDLESHSNNNDEFMDVDEEENGSMDEEEEEAMCAPLGYSPANYFFPKLEADLAALKEVVRRPAAASVLCIPISALVELLPTCIQAQPTLNVSSVALDLVECIDRLCSCMANIFCDMPFPSWNVDSNIADNVAVVLQVLAKVMDVGLDSVVALSSSVSTSSSSSSTEDDSGSSIVPALSGGAGGGGAAAAAAAAAAESERDDYDIGYTGEVDLDLCADQCGRCVASAAEAISALCRRAPVTFLQRAGNAALLSLALVISRGALSRPDISVPSLAAASALGCKDGEAEATAAEGGARSIVDTRASALLTNSALRALEHALMQLNKQGLAVSACVVSLLQSLEPEKATETEVHETAASLSSQDITDSIMRVEASVSALIDLHSSDDSAFLQNFIKFKVVSRLQTALEFFRPLFAGLVVNRKLGGGESVGGSVSLPFLEYDEIAKVQETMLNAKKFLKYKQQFLKSQVQSVF